MRVFKTKWMARFTRRQQIDDQLLIEVVERAVRGLIDADLGGGLIKQRVAREGSGRSGGHRMLIAYRAGSRAVFVYGFAKNERDNINADELLTLREIGAAWLEATSLHIERALNDEILKEVDNGNQRAN